MPLGGTFPFSSNVRPQITRKKVWCDCASRPPLAMEDENADASSLQSMVRGLVSPSLELLILWGSKYLTRLSWHRFSEAKIAFMGQEQANVPMAVD